MAEVSTPRFLRRDDDRKIELRILSTVFHVKHQKRLRLFIGLLIKMYVITPEQETLTHCQPVSGQKALKKSFYWF